MLVQEYKNQEHTTVTNNPIMNISNGQTHKKVQVEEKYVYFKKSNHSPVVSGFLGYLLVTEPHASFGESTNGMLQTTNF